MPVTFRNSLPSRFSLLFAFLLMLSSCADQISPLVKPVPLLPDNGFPESVSSIFHTSCAGSGCHTAENGQIPPLGMDLSTWEAVFAGSDNGTAVVPFAPDQSFLFLAANTNRTLGPAFPHPTDPISAADQQAIYDWIQEGAPDREGSLYFPEDPNRKKYYISNQGCDLVAVIDAASGQIMKYVEVGDIDGFVEAPHMIRVSPDGEFWYVVFLANNPYIEKYSTLTDEFVGRAEIGQGDWNTFVISPDGKYGYAVAYATRIVSCVNLETLAFEETLQWGRNLHGSAINGAGNKLYVTEQDGDDIIIFEFLPPLDVQEVQTVDLEQGIPRSRPASFGPYEVTLSPDGARYFVTCQSTYEVRVFQTSNDSLLAAIEVGPVPQEMAFDEQRNRLFVTCMEDQTSFPQDPDRRGSIAVIDLNTLTLINTLYSGYQPHGLEVDVTANRLIVANRNSAPGGPAPHHSTRCGGRNGYVTAIDLNTLEVTTDFRQEVSVDPYSVAIKE